MKKEMIRVVALYVAIIVLVSLTLFVLHRIYPERGGIPVPQIPFWYTRHYLDTASVRPVVPDTSVMCGPCLIHLCKRPDGFWDVYNNVGRPLVVGQNVTYVYAVSSIERPSHRLVEPTFFIHCKIETSRIDSSSFNRGLIVSVEGAFAATQRYRAVFDYSSLDSSYCVLADSFVGRARYDGTILMKTRLKGVTHIFRGVRRLVAQRLRS